MAVHLKSGARLESLTRIDSTSAEAARRIADGETGPLWISALEQTAGYGRRGAPWTHAPGDLAATFIFPSGVQSGGDTGVLAQLSFVAAVALHAVLERFAPGAPVALKWPNDVFLGGRKISGLLLELKETPSGFVVCLGLGVNLANAPSPEGRQTARLADAMADGGKTPAPQAVLAEFDEAFGVWRSIWAEHGFDPVRSAWLTSAFGLGERVCFEPAGATASKDAGVSAKGRATIGGVFAGLDETGALVLETDDGVQSYSAGSLYFENVPVDECIPATAVRAHKQ
ncbi:MAG: biotin--[acetyl-CoA-carboxylase] ligase [Pseudomonadota bacterium]